MSDTDGFNQAMMKVAMASFITRSVFINFFNVVIQEPVTFIVTTHEGLPYDVVLFAAGIPNLRFHNPSNMMCGYYTERPGSVTVNGNCVEGYVGYDDMTGSFAVHNMNNECLLETRSLEKILLQPA